MKAKEYLQNKYPSMRGERWNSTNIDDEWVASMMEAFASDESKMTAISFSKWIREQGYIYAGEGDYMYPDADGLIGGGWLFDEFSKKSND